MPEPKSFDEPEAFDTALNEACKEWQIRLGLQDWTVSVRTVRLPDVSDVPAVASIQYMLERKDAILRVAAPIDLPLVEKHFLNGEEKDYDFHLVHELLHLHFVGFPAEDNTPAGIAQEQAINAIGRSLVKAYRASGELATPAISPVGHYI